MLSDRRQRVLAALIEEYVSHALPVGSRTLVERYGLGVSPATVRNELSVLEDEGYITQPHTSAGRIPTDSGYRSFVDDLLEKEADQEPDEELGRAAEELRRSASELDDLFQKTTAALSRFTDTLSIVIPPSSISLHIRQISFISMTPYRVLIVIVTEQGQVFNRQVDFGEEISAEDLASLQNLFNRVLVGKDFAQIRDSLDEETVNALYGPLARTMLGETFACLQAGEGAHAHRIGLSALMQQPEFSNSSTVVPVLEVLEDETVLLELLQGVSGGSTLVRIGHENNASQLTGVSVVARQYGRGEGEGMIAVIGPTRMNYARVISAVRMAQRALEED